MKDYYEILEVHPKASQDVIKKAYTVLAKKYHPDVTRIDPLVARQRMIEINEAYAVLSNPQDRHVYDNQLANAATFSANQEAARKADEFIRQQRMQADREEYAKQVTIVSNRFTNSCKYYMDILNRRIFNSAAPDNISGYCNKLLNDFYNEISEDYQFIENNNVWTFELMDFYGTTLWWFGAGFEKAKDYTNARKVLNMADNFIDRSSTNFNAFSELKAKVDIEYNKNQRATDSNNNETRYCPKCGRQVTTSMHFCPKCGTKFNWESQPNVESAPQNIQTEQVSLDQKNTQAEQVSNMEEPDTTQYICPSCGQYITKGMFKCPTCNQRLSWENDDGTPIEPTPDQLYQQEVNDGCKGCAAKGCLGLFLLFILTCVIGNM